MKLYQKMELIWQNSNLSDKIRKSVYENAQKNRE